MTIGVQSSDHYFHTLSKHIVERCVDENVGVIVIGDVCIREYERKMRSRNSRVLGLPVGIRPIHSMLEY